MAFLATADPERAAAFFRDKLGLRLLEESPYALAFDAAGIMLRVQIVPAGVQPHPYTAFGWEVEDIRSAVLALTGNGVPFERFSGMPQDELGIWTAPGGARVAWFKDPDGNILSLTEFGS